MMIAYKYTGGCHCENITFEMELSKPLDTYELRACNCDFCRKHAASYISDPQGKLIITIRDKSNLNKYRQGSKIVDFLLCKNCGVLVAVCYEDNGNLYATANSRTIVGDGLTREEIKVSSKELDDLEKIHRWKSLWFSNAKIWRGDSGKLVV